MGGRQRCRCRSVERRVCIYYRTTVAYSEFAFVLRNISIYSLGCRPAAACRSAHTPWALDENKKWRLGIPLRERRKKTAPHSHPVSPPCPVQRVPMSQLGGKKVHKKSFKCRLYWGSGYRYQQGKTLESSARIMGGLR